MLAEPMLLKGVIFCTVLTLSAGCGKTATRELLDADYLGEPKVQDVRVVDLSTDSATLTWQAFPPGSSMVELSTTATFQTIAFASPEINGLRYTFSGLTAKTTYFYRVRNSDRKGRSGAYVPNPVAAFTVPVNLDPSLPRLSCNEIRTLFPSYTSGEYLLDTDGSGPNAPFTAYCDMTFSDGTTAGRWTLVLAYNDNQGPLLSTDTPPAKVTRGINKKEFMPMSRLEPLVRNSTQLAIRTHNTLPNNYIIAKLNTAPLQNLVYNSTGSSLNLFPGFTNAASIDATWMRGSGIGTAQLAASGCAPLDYPYPESIYHPCGNGSGFHFIPRNSQTNWSGGAAGNLDLELLVR